MSHAEGRKENNCLNCGAIVQGRYCHVCGQENVVPHDTFWHMVKHFFYDITHFDSKFFDTVHHLIRKPGFLSKEYLAGRRASYLDPIKMYVFTSAVFFIIFFSRYSFKGMDKTFNETAIPTSKELTKVEGYALGKAKSKPDSNTVIKTFELIRKDTVKLKDTVGVKGFQLFFDDSTKQYSSLKEYDSVQKSLPEASRDGWFKRSVNRKSIGIRQRYEGRENQLFIDLADKFIHTFPYLLFVSLPLYALFLKLLYIRHKKLYFIDHGILLLHLYIFTFILMMVFFGIDELRTALGWGGLGFLQAALIIYGIWYAYKCLRNFYGQRRGKTIVKFILFNFLCFVSLIFLFVVFLAFTVIRV